jgi:alpha-galactosidase
VGDDGLSGKEMQSQMSLWAVMAAPLISSSTDLTKISPSALAVLGNTDVIAIDQDPAGVQGHIVQFDDE